MNPTTLAAPFDRENSPVEARRISPEPIEGYVLEPWSGLYQETDVAYQARIHDSRTVSA